MRSVARGSNCTRQLSSDSLSKVTQSSSPIDIPAVLYRGTERVSQRRTSTTFAAPLAERITYHPPTARTIVLAQTAPPSGLSLRQAPIPAKPPVVSLRQLRAPFCPQIRAIAMPRHPKRRVWVAPIFKRGVRVWPGVAKPQVDTLLEKDAAPSGLT